MPQTQAPAGALRGLVAVLVLLTAMLVGMFVAIDRNLDRFYIFDPDHLHDLAKRSITAHGDDTKAVVGFIMDELRQTHPGVINEEQEWVFNNHGSAMGGMFILHASITEYLIIYGTAVGTEGHTGRHTADDYFHILKGTETAYTLGSYEAEVYPPGSQHHLPRGSVKQYRMSEGCFALEYARGWIPPMMPFGLADTLTSTMDVLMLWKTVRITAGEMLGNLAKGKL